MSSLTNTVSKNRRPAAWRFALAVTALSLAALAYAQDVTLRAPSDAVAGNAATISASGSGSATFYLIGPSTAVKRDVQLGQEISLSAKEIQSSGRYVAVVCAGSCASTAFFVAPSKPVSLAFLVHPSRAPVAKNDLISGVVLPLDEYRNLVLTPASVDFQLSAKGGAPVSHKVETRNGAAWFRISSGKSAGPLQITASMNDVVARRVVQQVASDPCNLRIKGQRTPKGIEVETDPVRDCSGNPVPDGTIITFTAKNGDETSTVDAPVKQDVARARILAKGPVVISAASGVVMGNELHLSGQ
ncbi:MAG TPA: hypothetical protein VKQ11_20365 [Candidatus Sulfotelmatobacter sp.]|nr:hypothetical protein [Candidatus Sulfotelmatobacter sp.]